MSEWKRLLLFLYHSELYQLSILIFLSLQAIHCLARTISDGKKERRKEKEIENWTFVRKTTFLCCLFDLIWFLRVQTLLTVLIRCCCCFWFFIENIFSTFEIRLPSSSLISGSWLCFFDFFRLYSSSSASWERWKERKKVCDFLMPIPRGVCGVEVSISRVRALVCAAHKALVCDLNNTISRWKLKIILLFDCYVMWNSISTGETRGSWHRWRLQVAAKGDTKWWTEILIMQIEAIT